MHPWKLAMLGKSTCLSNHSSHSSHWTWPDNGYLSHFSQNSQVIKKQRTLLKVHLQGLPKEMEHILMFYSLIFRFPTFPTFPSGSWKSESSLRQSNGAETGSPVVASQPREPGPQAHSKHDGSKQAAIVTPKSLFNVVHLSPQHMASLYGQHYRS